MTLPYVWYYSKTLGKTSSWTQMNFKLHYRLTNDLKLYSPDVICFGTDARFPEWYDIKSGMQRTEYQFTDFWREAEKHAGLPTRSIIDHKKGGKKKKTACLRFQEALWK